MLFVVRSLSESSLSDPSESRALMITFISACLNEFSLPEIQRSDSEIWTLTRMCSLMRRRKAYAPQDALIH